MYILKSREFLENKEESRDILQPLFQKPTLLKLYDRLRVKFKGLWWGLIVKDGSPVMFFDRTMGIWEESRKVRGKTVGKNDIVADKSVFFFLCDNA